MKNFLILIVFFSFSFSCSYKPLYKKNVLFSKYDIAIKIKSDGKYEDNINVMRSILQKRLKHKSSKPSSLKLVIAIKRSIVDLGINKDLFSKGRAINYFVNYSFYDKKGLLTSGNLKGKTSYNIGENTYANIVYKEDASKKLLSSLSQNLADIITAMDFKRTISP
tara:strand:- start:884 stop:1378 length:495 start_codon:yes stop_codon:yes gene_type:complete